MQKTIEQIDRDLSHLVDELIRKAIALRKEFETNAVNLMDEAIQIRTPQHLIDATFHHHSERINKFEFTNPKEN
jgi:flagellar biosynthesis component FlhA